MCWSGQVITCVVVVVVVVVVVMRKPHKTQEGEEGGV